MKVVLKTLNLIYLFVKWDIGIFTFVLQFKLLSKAILWQILAVEVSLKSLNFFYFKFVLKSIAVASIVVLNFENFTFWTIKVPQKKSFI